jgi:hypothetical protein
LSSKQPIKKQYIKDGVISLKILANSEDEIRRLLLFLDSKYKPTNSAKWSKIKYCSEDNYYFLKIFFHDTKRLGEDSVLYSIGEGV